MVKPKVALIYKSDERGMSGHHYTTGSYHFFVDGLQQNDRIDVTYHSIARKLHAADYKGHDLLLVFNLIEGVDWSELAEINKPKIASNCDGHRIPARIDLFDKCGIGTFINSGSTVYARKFLPERFHYCRFSFGIDADRHISPPWEERLKKPILVTGEM
ncbi:unnamed protein product, partial [marine sediment metagenome]